MNTLNKMWKGIPASLFVLVTLLSLSSCGGDSGGSIVQPPIIVEPPPPVEAPIEDLWVETVRPLLQAELWNSQNNYDAAHVLMIPLHWTYAINTDAQFTEDFETYFGRFIEQGTLSNETNQLRKLQYLYLHSQYLKLKTQHASLSEDDQAMLDQLLTEIEYQWVERETRTFGNITFNGGMKERLEFKLNTFDPSPEYARAIFDEEFYLLTIAADLMVVLRDDTVPDMLLDIQDAALRLFTQEGTDVDNGWLFQIGVWSHHRDYVYSGNTVLETGLSQVIIEDIPTDSSHFHRMPLWVTSLRDSYTSSEEEFGFYNTILQRIAAQFEEFILVPADEEFKAPRMNNFTDGWNGIYRYGFDTVGENLGFGPYGISGTLPYSWYAFMPSSALLEAYTSLEFPLPQNVVDLYVGPNTTRVRHPLVTWPGYFENGFAELDILLASKLLSQSN